MDLLKRKGNKKMRAKMKANETAIYLETSTVNWMENQTQKD